MCHHAFIYDGWDKNTNSQTNVSIKYISNTHGRCDAKLNLLQLDNDKYLFLEYVLEDLIDEKGCEIDNYNY